MFPTHPPAGNVLDHRFCQGPLAFAQYAHGVKRLLLDRVSSGESQRVVEIGIADAE
jgi:hypothetical protein